MKCRTCHKPLRVHTDECRCEFVALRRQLTTLRKAASPFAFYLEWAFSGGKTLPDDEDKVSIRIKAGDLRRLAEEVKDK